MGQPHTGPHSAFHGHFYSGGKRINCVYVTYAAWNNGIPIRSPSRNEWIIPGMVTPEMYDPTPGVTYRYPLSVNR